jgi:hypothetical protein
VTEAYKLYCKIKKKQELVKNGVSPESKANNSTCVQNDEDVPIKEVPIKEPEKDPGPSIWGDSQIKSDFLNHQFTYLLQID